MGYLYPSGKSNDYTEQVPSGRGLSKHIVDRCFPLATYAFSNKRTAKIDFFNVFRRYVVPCDMFNAVFRPHDFMDAHRSILAYDELSDSHPFNF